VWFCGLNVCARRAPRAFSRSNLTKSRRDFSIERSAQRWKFDIVSMDEVRRAVTRPRQGSLSA
jgi:hypothetical protein